jgi:hypothetical protein
MGPIRVIGGKPHARMGYPSRGLEAAAVITCFAAFGRFLGIRR